MHVLIAMNVHAISRSRNLLDYLSRHWLSITYEEVIRIRARWAYYIHDLSLDNLPIIPHFEKKLFGKASIDNFDFVGKVSNSHHSIMVAFQVFNNCLIETPRISKTNVDCNKRRFNSQFKWQEIKPFPQSLVNIVLPDQFSLIAAQNVVDETLYVSSSRTNFISTLLRFVSSQNLKFSSNYQLL